MTPSRKSSHLVNQQNQSQATRHPKEPPSRHKQGLTGGAGIICSGLAYASVLVCLVSLHPLITLAALELMQEHGLAAGITAWVIGSITSTYALLGHLRRSDSPG